MGEALWKSLKPGPVFNAEEPASNSFESLIEEIGRSPERTGLARIVDEGQVRAVLRGVVEGSPYLCGLMRQDLKRLERILVKEPDVLVLDLRRELEDALTEAADLSTAMAKLRSAKGAVALLTALCDLGEVWPVMKVTRVLTDFADHALNQAIRFLFRAEMAKGRWQPVDPERPEVGSGLIVLGMGKYGAFELNYSSDIDLIVLFEKETGCLGKGVDVQPFFVRMTKDLVRLMQERTADGYVFRTDLRLRPDAGATQIALSTDASLSYYESFGQNWERAAMIKARPVAGDLVAGERFLEQIQPFIWRKHLDFAAIADVHAMKRQVQAFRGFGEIRVAGHNIKVGRGGIREIEFFVQTQQLIAGGRQPMLRVRDTLTVLGLLEEFGWIEADVRGQLAEAYVYLRRIEHRIQMVADEQTHQLPDAEDRLASLASFCGYPTVEAFSDELRQTLELVQSHYAALFENAPELTTRESNMVFAGQEDDPQTVTILAEMGYSNPSNVIATVRGWHSGRYRSVRSQRSRERLTEVQPVLLEALAQTADPDGAFNSFDRFLSELPMGIQLFSMLSANPALLRLVADIMGTSPRLSAILSKRARLLDAVIDPQTFDRVPTKADLAELVRAELERGSNLEEVLNRARIVGSEQSFLIGIRVLSGNLNASLAGEAYAKLAEVLIEALQNHVEEELVKVHGQVPGGGAALIAMGKLGGHDLTASSDVDLILVYDHDANVTQSDGPRALAPSQYYARLTQRLISAISAPTAEGVLYEVDMRLRPSGQQGPVATRLSSFVRYQAEEAWTWEHMALTRARVISGPPALTRLVDEAIEQVLRAPRDRQKTAREVIEMRERIFEAKGSDDVWDLKNVRGGLIDLEFIAQYLQLVHACEKPEVLEQNTTRSLEKLLQAGVLSPDDGETLVKAAQLFHDVIQVLRICVSEKFNPASAPPGLQLVVSRAGGEPDCGTLETRLRETTHQVARLFSRIVC